MPGLLISNGKLYKLYTGYLSIIFGQTEEFSDKMDLIILMTTCNNVKHRHAIHFKFGGRFPISVTVLGVQAKSNAFFTI